MAVWTEEQALRQLEVWGLVLWRWALKPLLYALIAAVLTGFVILASIELYPPFNSSPSADAIVASSESAEDTIETMRDASRKLRDDLRRAGAADLKACLNPKDPKAARTPSECVDDALAAVQTANSAFDAGLYKAAQRHPPQSESAAERLGCFRPAAVDPVRQLETAAEMDRPGGRGRHSQRRAAGFA
ncbi:MAG: hypothetical protein WDN08_16225 [Rhizomicrobium sp.]